MDTPTTTSRSVSADTRDGSSAFMRRILSPFSAAAVASLPNVARPQRYHRADAIPDYHAINALPPQVRVPKKIATPVRVEAKVWFANERTWIAWLNIAILLGTLALALFNTSKDTIATRFAYAYALISVGVLIYAFALYQYRISMIRRRDPGHFDSIAGPVTLAIVLFTAILVNFIVRVRELKQKEVPIPGAGLFTFLQNNTSSVLGFYTQQ
ncbi:hypothetical protein H0H87_004738 [Tephrocybe sp. NHM501043]|nr:hypothetical protein H0H87_004738 [Tephrocybe sp. NHM501043]